MNPVFQRTARIIGEDGVELLARKTAAVFGIGGVGSYAAEALVRAGVGHLIFIDKDRVDVSNVNRQLVADVSTLGRLKAEVMPLMTCPQRFRLSVSATGFISL